MTIGEEMLTNEEHFIVYSHDKWILVTFWRKSILGRPKGRPSSGQYTEYGGSGIQHERIHNRALRYDDIPKH